ncbi:MAG TPA: hypothetical protein VH186_07110, partial [Chloroflexia bacterium]|nr:hypothetical protein [Chloroflexia bacterium]
HPQLALFPPFQNYSNHLEAAFLVISLISKIVFCEITSKLQRGCVRAFLLIVVQHKSTDGQSGSYACRENIRPKKAKAKGVRLEGQGSMKQEASRSNPVEAVPL